MADEFVDRKDTGEPDTPQEAGEDTQDKEAGETRQSGHTQSEGLKQNEQVSGNTLYTRDIRGETVNVQQSKIYNVTILNNASEGFSSTEDFIKKFAHGAEKLGDAYEFAFQRAGDEAIVLNKDGDQKDAEIKPPEEKALIEKWYCELNEWKMCFVQAAVVLHGAPVHKIRDAAETLYHNLLTSSDATKEVKLIDRTISEEELCTNLYMKIEYTNGAERLFWLDANTNGLSTFAVRLLPIIVRQSNLSATHQKGLNFLKQLELWPTTFSGECAWKATRALGGIWLKSDSARFRSMLNERKISDNPDDWRRAATLLDGAYEVEYAEHGEDINQGNKSFVLTLLADWTDQAHTSMSANNTLVSEKIGSTVAQAYGRIGQRSIKIALEGLERLLRYPLRHKEDQDIVIPLSVFGFSTSSYVMLARFGYIREVIQQLTCIVEKYCYSRNFSQHKEKHQYPAECRFMLEVAFQVFFVIAALSLIGVKDKTPGNYKREAKLDPRPILPDKEGKDLLLASILSCEELELSQNITTILCGAILEKNGESAFFLMKLWAEIVLKEPGEQRHPLREAFLSFMVKLKEKGDLWCYRLAGVNECDYEDLFSITYREKLQEWQIRRRDVPPQPLGAFAKDICKKLNF
jgi:hypothetical protein